MGSCKECSKDCKYLSRVRSGTLTCNYILVNYEPRGCEAGKNCTKYEKGKRIRLKDDRLW